MDLTNHKLINDYLIIEQIGSGSFGEVYLAKHKSGGYVAVKVEDKKKPHRVYIEYKIYKNLHSSNFKVGLPKIYGFIETTDNNIMIMQLLGPSLEDLFNKYNRKFTMSTILMMVKQLLYLFKQLHEAHYIHRDIKPNNFLIGRDTKCDQIYMMDFGLSKKYIVQDKHLKFRGNRSLIGTARYASINMHYGFEPSRRDDLESVGYMLIYFIKGILPWQGIKKQTDNKHLELIGEKKMCTSLDELCKDIPGCFKKYLVYCRQLGFDEQPDYDYLQELFDEYGQTVGISPAYQWRESKIRHL